MAHNLHRMSMAYLCLHLILVSLLLCELNSAEQIGETNILTTPIPLITEMTTEEQVVALKLEGTASVSPESLFNEISNRDEAGTINHTEATTVASNMAATATTLINEVINNDVLGETEPDAMAMNESGLPSSQDDAVQTKFSPTPISAMKSISTINQTSLLSTTILPTELMLPQKCYSCNSANDATCIMHPIKQIECKPLNESNGCFYLVKVDNKITMRGCLSELAEEGKLYCKQNSKHCDICYGPACNNITKVVSNGDAQLYRPSVSLFVLTAFTCSFY